MFDIEIQSLLSKCGTLDDFVDHKYEIRDRIFTGEEVLDLLDIFGNYTSENLEEAQKNEEIYKGALEKLSKRYLELKERFEFKNPKIEKLRKELRNYKGEFVGRLKKIIDE